MKSTLHDDIAAKQPVKLRQKLQVAIQLVKILNRASRQDSTDLQTEDMLVKSFERLNISAPSIQMFKDRLEKVRQSAPHSNLEDTYVMGGILIYCGILLPILLSLGIPDFPARFAWIVFAISFPCTVGYFLTRFLKERNGISSSGGIYRSLAILAQIGVIATTASLFFHVWNVSGWLFLLSALAIFIVYQCYRFGIYFKPFFSIFRDILKNINDTTPPGK
jgi:hypothetical protein